MHSISLPFPSLPLFYFMCMPSTKESKLNHTTTALTTPQRRPHGHTGPGHELAGQGGKLIGSSTRNTAPSPILHFLIPMYLPMYLPTGLDPTASRYGSSL